MARASIRDISVVLGFATRPRAIKPGPLRQSQRLSASAGALHPIELLLVERRGQPRVMRYNSWENTLESLIIAQPKSLRIFCKRVDRLLPEASGTPLVLVGNKRRVAARYRCPDSLLWRDSGCLIQTLALSAEAFSLRLCPLGILGNEVVTALGLETEAVATGVVLIGTSA